MALIVESGAGLADAEAYISVADATAYHAARGNAAWASLASDTVREQLLRKATDYMGQAYRTQWAGSRLSTTQSLDWPRIDVPVPDVPWAYYPSDTVLTAVKNACAELALKASTADLLADQSGQVKQETVGPITIVYADGARQVTKYTAIDGMLAGLIGGGSQIKLYRA